MVEGVETDGQLEQLQRLGCQTAQGFLWSQAIHRDELLALLNAGTTFDVGETQGVDRYHPQTVEMHVSILDERANAGSPALPRPDLPDGSSSVVRLGTAATS